MLIRLFVLCLTFVFVHPQCFGTEESLLDSSPNAKAQGSKCGYDSCPKSKPGFLNVHLVPHTHDDVGWLKTVDQYYYGIKNDIQDVSVQFILDSVVDELKSDPDKRFIYVETAFFWKWWTRQTENKKNLVKRLVANGQLEFIGGAWSMNDEATTNYMSIIDQFTWGLRKLNDTFGTCGQPRIGWQIDPFGHSKEQASLFAQLGFDGFFMARIDYQDKRERLKNKDMEMIWQGSYDLGPPADIFTHILYNHYTPPDGFCFDLLCSGNSLVDDQKSPEYNIDQKLREFFEWVQMQKTFYKSSNIILTMGNDFSYQYAHSWYKNMDILIREGNARQNSGSNVNIFYSTPSCYVKAVHQEKLSFPPKDDDFFPYASDPHAYWTGYFTSRPTIKYYERLGNNYLQVCKQLNSLTDAGPEEQVELNTMRSAMGVLQHHDAITGTEKQHVANDYARILSEGFAMCDKITSAALNKLIKKVPMKLKQKPQNYKKIAKPLTKRVAGDTKSEKLAKLKDSITQEIPAPIYGGNIPFFSCNLLNISVCNISEENSRFVLTVYNPSSQFVNKHIRIPIRNTSAYEVQDPQGQSLTTQVVPIHPSVLNIPGRKSEATHELIFKAERLPPLGFKSYYISLDSYAPHRPVIVEESFDFSIGDNEFGLAIDEMDGLVKTFFKEGDELEVEHNMFYYNAMEGNNEVFENRSSGAYIFRPDGIAQPINETPERTIYKGPIVNEIHVTYSDWCSEVIRLYNGENHIEFEWLVGPIPTEKVGKEIISRFSTNINSSGTFYTDSNGRQLIKRFRNERSSYNVNLHEEVAGNYYPVTSRIVINDENVRMAIITDRAQGGSSLENGQMELMVHRKLLHDDDFGVGEALNEEAFGAGLVARGTHYVTVGNNTRQPILERQLEMARMIGSWMFFSPASDMTFDEWSKTYQMQFSGLSKALPPNVQVLTLEPWKGRSLLLRLEHIYQRDDDVNLSNNASIDLQKLFSPFRVTSARETILGANQWAGEAHRLNWMYQSNSLLQSSRHSMHQDSLKSVGQTIILSPMQIRTFIIEVAF